ncbi:PQQ-binding-like beta-propeller repeat protein [Brevibacillus ginsengisoli]|uniref:PQQ-binding-like beta-propeller repeat protein n=1 Tax=Brevibacillus ginsengisoli TaxID=363854 RepID=UPI003CF3160B
MDNQGEVRWINKNIQRITETKLSTSIWYQTNVKRIVCDHEGNVYIATDDQLFKTDSKGNIIWSKNIKLYDDQIYLTQTGLVILPNDKAIIMLNGSNGAEVKQQQVNLSEIGVPTDGKNGIYLNYGTFGLMNIDINGKVKWRYLTGDSQYYYLDNIVSDPLGNVYFANTAGNIYSLDANDHERFILVRKNAIQTSSSIVVGKNGVIYVYTENIGIIAIGPKEIQKK